MMQLHYNHIIIPLQTGKVALLNEKGKCLSSHETVSEAVRRAKEISDGIDEADNVDQPCEDQED